MTQPTTAMEAWQAAQDAAHKVTDVFDWDYVDDASRNKLFADADQAAARVIAAAFEARESRLRKENRRLIEAGNEMEDKLWVLRCNSRDALDRHAAESAILMWTEARTLLAGERGE